MVVYFFGDSITQGFWDLEGGWPVRVRKYYDQKYLSKNSNSYHSFFNLGIDGNTIRNVINRFEGEIDARRPRKAECVLVFAIGTNDTIFRGAENVNEPDDFNEELHILYDKAKKYSSNIFFLGLTPVEDSLLNPMPWSKSGKCYSTNRMKLFNDVIQAFCTQDKAAFIDIWTDFETNGVSDLMHDGLHPDSRGHKIISEKIIRVLNL